ncbi:hypothetical protein [Streptomyces fagopyri]|uniref:hypothetical protein n=1 Tax=Streptomyces fagopyri TaxID=2662397 RepID=UPI0033EF19AB
MAFPAWVDGERPRIKKSLTTAQLAVKDGLQQLRDLTVRPGALRDAGHEPAEKHTRQLLRDLASGGLLVKVQDRPVLYRTESMNE